MAGDIGFDHVTVVVTDTDEGCRFFSLLGFEESARVVVEGDTMASYMQIEGWKADHITLVHRGAPVHQEVQLLHFHHPEVELDEGSGNLARSGFNHLCFRVGDLDEEIAKLEAAGFSTRNEVMDFHDRRLVFVEGPAGVTVELAQWLTPPSGP